MLMSLPPIIFTHIPRECHKSVDFAAGLASAALLQQKEDNRQQQTPTSYTDLVFRPLHIEIVTGPSWAQQAAAAPMTADAEALALQETPDLRQLHRALKLAYHDPKHRKGLRPYLEYIGYGQQTLPVPVQY